MSGSDLSRPIWVQLSICAVSDGRPPGTLPVSRSANIIFVLYLHMGYDDILRSFLALSEVTAKGNQLKQAPKPKKAGIHTVYTVGRPAEANANLRGLSEHE